VKAPHLFEQQFVRPDAREEDAPAASAEVNRDVKGFAHW
jgi:hypothetical protein